MELSSEVHSLLEKFRLLKKQSEESVSCERSINQTSNYDLTFEDNDLIKLEAIQFPTDEFWLYKPEERNSSPVKDLNRWLSKRDEDLQDEYFHKQHLQMVREMAKLNSHKIIDSRTYTRPKKRNSRPSLERFNDELLERKSKGNDPESDPEPPQTAPLDFDLSQPTHTSMFDSILAAAPELDSFQNMSPPSLINSMCSSTFTTLMDNSYIKNDPILREIRDTDYSETILLEDSDPPMFRSFTGSCSSVNSDVPEGIVTKGFLRNCSRVVEEEKEDSTEVVGVNASDVSPDENEFYSPEGTPPPERDYTISLTTHKKSNTTANLSTAAHLNTTLDLPAHTPYLNGTRTFIKNTKQLLKTTNDMTYSTDSLDEFRAQNATFTNNSPPIVNLNRNNTFTKPRENTDSNVKNLSAESLSQMTYQSVEDICQNSTYSCDMNHTTDLKRNSFGNSAGSADSLDRMSSLSDNSSKGSNRVLNMAEVDAIVTRQEMSLQIFSTPKPASALRKPLDPLSPRLSLSPIKPKEPCSDSELSSNEDYASVRTNLSKVSSLVSVADYTRGVPKSGSAAHLNSDRTMQMGSGATASQPLLAARSAKGSLTNLRSVGGNLRGSYTCLRSAAAVGGNLRGSLASLKGPALDGTTVVAVGSKESLDETVVVEASENFKMPAVRDTCRATGDSASVNPHARINSALPRPATASSTGIPRPVSRIPGPRTLRPAVSRTSLRPGKQANENIY